MPACRPALSLRSTAPGVATAVAAVVRSTVTPLVTPLVTSIVTPIVVTIAAPILIALTLMLLAGPAAAQPAAAGAPPIAVHELHRPNVVVVLRHASAPGVSDPPGFTLDDCRTQRNLDERGRRQAASLGASWKAGGFRPSRVLSSAWCRCQETARLMDLGPVHVHPLLNSFFGGDAQARDTQAERLSRFIDGLDPRGGPYLMVTHQVVISALTGHGAESGGGVAIELPTNGGGRRKTRLLPAAGID